MLQLGLILMDFDHPSRTLEVCGDKSGMGPKDDAPLVSGKYLLPALTERWMRPLLTMDWFFPAVPFLYAMYFQCLYKAMYLQFKATQFCIMSQLSGHSVYPSTTIYLWYGKNVNEYKYGRRRQTDKSGLSRPQHFLLSAIGARDNVEHKYSKWQWY